MKRHWTFWTLFAVLVLAFSAPPLLAQDQNSPPDQPQQDQSQQDQAQSDNSPADASQQAAQQPGIARLSYIQGNVSTQHGGNGDWIAVTANTPVESGDRVSTGDNSRAELQLDSTDVLRMSASSSAQVAALSRSNIKVQVGEGLVTYSVLKGSQADTEIDTPNMSLHPDGPGDYRILVNSSAETQVIVRSGSAQISTPQGSTEVQSGQMITVAGTDNPEYKIASAPDRDEWDSWNADRDKTIEDAASWRHTDQYYTGSEDLDNYGVWSEVPDYGQVWIPQQTAGWAPYRDGRWVWEPYYGWTWVSYDPWGWAPYHYGRWFLDDGSWAWWPGPIGIYPGYYPLWSPAYVSFFGWGGGFGFGFGFGFGGWGHIGWFPCGPGDWFHPWYGRWGGRVNVVAFNNFHEGRGGFGPLAGRGWHQYSNLHEAFSNARVRSGFSSMAGSEFGHGAVPQHQQALSAASFRQASLMTGRMPVNPTRASYSPTGRSANPSTIRGSSPHFFSASRANASRSAQPGLSRSAGSFNRQSRPAAASSRGASAMSRSTNWRSFTPPAGRSNGTAQGARSFNRGTDAYSATHGGFEKQNSSSSQQSRQSQGWNHFTPPSSHGAQPNGRNFDSSRSFSSPSREPGNRSYFSGRNFQPPTNREATPSRTYDRYAPSSRPPLNMRQPIVSPRNGGNYGSSRGYSAPSRSYSAPRSYSSPSRSYSAPSRSYSAPSRSYSSPSYSAPRSSGGGGGGFHGGGGGGGFHGGGGGGGGFHGGGGGHGRGR